MTRINCVPVAELHDKHLSAEYRELPRVFALAAAACARGEVPADHPSEYTLGAGHVKFFYTRLAFLRHRHKALVAEMRRRGWSPQHEDVPGVANHLHHDWWRDWTPTPTALALNRARILARQPKPRLR